MKKQRKILLFVIIVIFGILALIIGTVALPWILIYGFIFLSPNPPEPEIKYAEFPFCLKYSINGEEITVQDTLICEYDGVEGNEGTMGKYRKWKGYLASGKSRITLFSDSNVKSIFPDGEIALRQEIYYDTGEAGYYMGDSEEFIGYKHNFPDASCVEECEDGFVNEGIVKANKLFNRFKIKLISWNPSPPIENKFG